MEKGTLLDDSWRTFKTEAELSQALNNPETFDQAKAQILKALELREKALGITPFRIDEEEIERLSKLSFKEIDRELGLIPEEELSDPFDFTLDFPEEE